MGTSNFGIYKMWYAKNQLFHPFWTTGRRKNVSTKLSSSKDYKNQMFCISKHYWCWKTNLCCLQMVVLPRSCTLSNTTVLCEDINLCNTFSTYVSWSYFLITIKYAEISWKMSSFHPVLKLINLKRQQTKQDKSKSKTKTRKTNIHWGTPWQCLWIWLSVSLWVKMLLQTVY